MLCIFSTSNFVNGLSEVVAVVVVVVNIIAPSTEIYFCFILDDSLVVLVAVVNVRFTVTVGFYFCCCRCRC